MVNTCFYIFIGRNVCFVLSPAAYPERVDKIGDMCYNGIIGTTHAKYTYYADNLRASKTVNGTTTDFVWNGQNLAMEATDETVNTYTYDMTGVHIANQNGDVTSYIKDYHGSVTGKADKDGNKTEDSFNYTAFGENLENTPDPFGYCGEYYDEESGLVYLRNRYYDTTTGRFITEDPIKDGANWYSYCGSNPVVLVDPMGLYSLQYDDYGRVYAVIDLSAGDTLYKIAQAEVGNGDDWKKMNYGGDPGYLQDGEWVDITEIYNGMYPNPNPKAGTMGLTQFINHALNEEGYEEGYGNNTKYGEWYGMNGQPWCAMFVSWAANRAGLLGNIIPRYAACYSGRDWYSERGKFYSSDSGYIPKAGDVFFTSSKEYPNGGAHTGIVVAYDNGYIYTVEGNSNDSVRVLKRSVSSVYGFGSNGGIWSGEIPSNYTNGGGRTY